MLKVTKVQPIAAHRDYTRKDKGNFQEIYCKAQEKYAQAEEALKNYHGSLAELHEEGN